MAIPLLYYPLSSQNQRVVGYEIPGDEQPKIYRINLKTAASEIDQIIWAAYRQIFNEQQILQSHRQIALESQLRTGQITVRDFIRGLVLSDSFRRLNYDSNTNYRFVEMCVQRLLGRQIYNQQETLSWSILLATKGLKGFIDKLLNSGEYLDYFGEETVPYQRRRVLPGRSLGELPFARMARYDTYHLAEVQQQQSRLNWMGMAVRDRSAPVYRRVVIAVPALAVFMLIATTVLAIAP